MRVTAKVRTLKQLLEQHAQPQDRLLNVGSGRERLRDGIVNMDIVAGPNVDILGDAHRIPIADGSFDGCILYAVLQYCRDPFCVVSEVARVTKPGGLVLVDVPFLQPYCPEVGAVDRFRFSREGLVGMFVRDFDIIECGVSMAGGSSMAFLCRSIAQTWYCNKYVAKMMELLISAVVWPMGRLKFGVRHEVACALYLVGRKRKMARLETDP